MSRQFDRFMVSVNAAQRPKVKRMKRAGKEVRWAWFHGVLAIAAESPIRGCFLVGDLPADEHDVADMADVTVAEARKAIEVGRTLGMLYRDDEHDCERVHDWDVVNPAPKQDKTAADRQQRRRERIKAEREKAAVTEPSRCDASDGHAPVTPMKGEGEGLKNPPTPQGGNRQRDRDEYDNELRQWGLQVVPGADPFSVVPATKHALSRLSPTARTAHGVRWIAATDPADPFHLGDDGQAALRSEFGSATGETAA